MPSERVRKLSFALLLIAVVGIYADITLQRITLNVTPSDVFKRVDQVNSSIKSDLDIVKSSVESLNKNFEIRNRWNEETAKQLLDIRDELGRRGDWMKQTQNYIDQATEDRWRKSDALRYWQSFFEANPTLVRPGDGER